MAGSNYPPGVTGSEPEIVGEPESPYAELAIAVRRAMARIDELRPGGRDSTPYVALSRAIDELEGVAIALEEMADETLEEQDVEETTTGLEAVGEFDDLRILEIPLEAEHATNLLGRSYDVPRYAVLGVPKTGFTEGDRSDVQRILYSVRIQKTKPEVEEPISPFEQESKR